MALRTHPEGRSVLSDNIDSREAFAQALMLSLDEDPDTSNILGQSWGQFSANQQEKCEACEELIVGEQNQVSLKFRDD